MSVSSETEDGNIQNLLEAADMELMNKLFIFSYKKKSSINTKKQKSFDDLQGLKSNRYLIEDESFRSDILSNEPLKKFINKKMSSIIEKQICYVDFKPHNVIKRLKTEGIKLLRDSEVFLKLSCTSQGERKKRLAIVNNVNNRNRIHVSSIDARYIIQNSTIGYTKNRRNSLFKYHWDQSKFVLQYPENEFSLGRCKNQWNESKIAGFRRKRLL